MRELAAHPDVTFVLIFENKGEVVGVSNPHPHCQIYATNFMFKYIETELLAGRRHLERDGPRAVPGHPRRGAAGRAADPQPQHGSAIAFVPYFARYAYEMYVAPLRSVATHRGRWTTDERRDLATVLRDVVIRFDNLWRMPFPYVMALHQAPVKGETRRVPLPHRVPSAAAPAEPAEVPGRSGDRRRQLPQRHVARREGGRARRRRRPALPHRVNADARPFRRTRSSQPIQALHAASAATSSPRASRRRSTRCPASRARSEGDTIYAIDRVAEDVLVEEIGANDRDAGRAGSCSSPKGLPGGEVVVPAGADRAAPRVGRSSSIRSTARAA